MNIHHLELFYYVAKFGGITAAVRRMPYGIQQPSVSAQLAQLEKSLGVSLFNRRPFTMTAEGAKLYQAIHPFFSQLPDLAASIRAEGSLHLRIAACASVLRNHLPGLLQRMKEEKPDLRITLKEVDPDEVGETLLHQVADIAVRVVFGTHPPGIHVDELIRVPLALLVPADIPGNSVTDFMESNPVSMLKTGKFPLISLPPDEILAKLFQAGLSGIGAIWEPSVEVSTLEVVQDYVGRGFGIGMAVDVPHTSPPEGLRRIRLGGFEPLRIAAMYQGTPKPVVAWLLEELKTFVGKHLTQERS